MKPIRIRTKRKRGDGISDWILVSTMEVNMVLTDWIHPYDEVLKNVVKKLVLLAQ